MITKVINMVTGITTEYFCSPRSAVIAAHAKSLGDYEVWSYERNYYKLVTTGQWTVACGTFSAWLDENNPGFIGYPPTDQAEQEQSYNYCFFTNHVVTAARYNIIIQTMKPYTNSEMHEFWIHLVDAYKAAEHTRKSDARTLRGFANHISGAVSPEFHAAHPFQP